MSHHHWHGGTTTIWYGQPAKAAGRPRGFLCSHASTSLPWPPHLIARGTPTFCCAPGLRRQPSISLQLCPRTSESFWPRDWRVAARCVARHRSTGL